MIRHLYEPYDWKDVSEVIGDLIVAQQNCRIGRTYPKPDNFLFNLCSQAHHQFYKDQFLRQHEIIIESINNPKTTFTGYLDNIMNILPPKEKDI